MMSRYITRREFVGAAASVVALAGCGIMLEPAKASATTAYGSQVSMHHNGKTYYGKCMVGNGNGSSVTGYAITNTSSVVGTGHIGALVRVYSTSGRLMGSREAYNGSSTQYFNVQTDSFTTSAGAFYYADGSLFAWDGSGYVTKNIPRTPNVGRSREPFAVSEYPINADGFTFGSLLSAESVGEGPYLVSAVSEAGVEGFVRLEDIQDPIPRAPEEAVALYGEESSGTIPLFDLEGNQIDVFVLRYGGGNCEPFDAA